MKGQWIGEYTGTNEGSIIVNLDELPLHFEGVAYLHEKNKDLPSTAVILKTQNKDNKFQFNISKILPIHPYTNLIDSWNNIKDFFNDQVILPTTATIEGNWDDEILNLKWVTNIGTTGTCTLSKSKADKLSEYAPLVMNWEEYKRHVSSLEHRRYLFRGQNNPGRLRTTFHRTGRSNLMKFIYEDIQVLHKHLSARTKHVFSLEVPNENGAFYNLAQHHGYPTPLLDWSYSPYVAAFFAYRGISNQKAFEADKNDKVRIFVFDQIQWKNDWTQVQNLLVSGLHVSIGEFIAIENERMIPQQAASTITNIDDIETYIKSKEVDNKKYLYVIDLPVKERKKIIQELSHMGITAGSLFPGLDGACEELKERHFEI